MYLACHLACRLTWHAVTLRAQGGIGYGGGIGLGGVALAGTAGFAGGLLLGEALGGGFGGCRGGFGGCGGGFGGCGGGCGGW
jgi:hypothetical protein